LGSRPDAAAEAARLITSLGQVKSGEALKQVALENSVAACGRCGAGLECLWKSLPHFARLGQSGVPPHALPLIARWDKAGAWRLI